MQVREGDLLSLSKRHCLDRRSASVRLSETHRTCFDTSLIVPTSTMVPCGPTTRHTGMPLRMAVTTTSSMSCGEGAAVCPVTASERSSGARAIRASAIFKLLLTTSPCVIYFWQSGVQCVTPRAVADYRPTLFGCGERSQLPDRLHRLILSSVAVEIEEAVSDPVPVEV